MRICILLGLCILVTACAPYKPPLSETQVVDGHSIVIPPDFDSLPKEK